MATAKVTFNNAVILDLTDATASTGADIMSPKTAYIADGSKVTGTASGGITPTGNINITQAGVTDVTNYATATVPSGTAGTPTATKGAVSNHAVTVTPSVTNSAGYIDGGTKTGTGVQVTAAELESGTKSITQNGTGIDVTGYAAVDVAVQSAVNIDTKTINTSNNPVSVSFSSMNGNPKAFFLRSTSQISSSGSTTYYYINSMLYDGNANNYCDGNCFRIGSTRRVDPITTTASGGVVSGYTWSYSGSTLTINSSAASRSASPGAFNGNYELVYIY